MTFACSSLTKETNLVVTGCLGVLAFTCYPGRGVGQAAFIELQHGQWPSLVQFTHNHSDWWTPGANLLWGMREYGL
jgi:hypothetical protein